jgi:hypothetical protein
MKQKIFFCVAVILFGIAEISATTYYVKPDGNDDADGRSWTTAKATIAGSLNEATTNDQIFVAQGAYQLTAEIPMVEGINVYGGFAGTEASLNQRPSLTFGKTSNGNASVLDGKASANVRRRVLFQGAPFTIETLWDGFVIQNGYVTELEGGAGGGAFLRNKSVLNNCTITKCTSPVGGGIYGYEEVSITNCLVTDNLADGRGGGLTLYRGSKAVNCIILNNRSEIAGGAYVDREDGAKYARCSMTNCLVANNTATTGGGLFCNFADITNCTVVNNISTYSGSGIRTSSEYAVITNCLVWGNKENSGNSGNQVGGDENAATKALTYCAIQGGYTRGGAGEGIIDLEAANTGNDDKSYPAFKQPAGITGYSPIPANISQILAADWSISEASGCRNAGTPATSSLALPERDLAGHARINENRIDIGAYEAGNYNSLLSIAAGTVKIYPNPVSDRLFIETNGNTSPVELYSPAGLLLLQTQSNEMDVSTLNSGLYLLKVNDRTIKVIKK